MCPECPPLSPPPCPQTWPQVPGDDQDHDDDAGGGGDNDDGDDDGGCDMYENLAPSP